MRNEFIAEIQGLFNNHLNADGDIAVGDRTYLVSDVLKATDPEQYDRLMLEWVLGKPAGVPNWEDYPQQKFIAEMNGLPEGLSQNIVQWADYWAEEFEGVNNFAPKGMKADEIMQWIEDYSRQFCAVCGDGGKLSEFNKVIFCEICIKDEMETN